MKADDQCRLVLVGDDGDVYEASPQCAPRRLTWGWSDGDATDRLYYVWPSYSPDGAHVACFGVRTGASPDAGLYTVADDGVRMHEIWHMSDAAPISESWSHDSKHIALLLQSETQLELEIASLTRPGQTFTLERGVPLFWSWSPTDCHIAVHTGGSASLYGEARLSIYRIGDDAQRIASLTPGEFRSPTWSPDGKRIAYVEATQGGYEHLAFYRVEDEETDLICPVSGQTVMLWSPDGKQIAVSQAPGDSPHLYSGITLVDVETGRSRVVEDRELASFYWSPCSKRIVTMSFDEAEGMSWAVLDVTTGARREGASFYPSRELVYLCWFFDQFAQSHPLISPDGSQLAFAGRIGARSADEMSPDVASCSNIYVASLNGDPDIRRVAPGHFACWDARVRDISPTRVSARIPSTFSVASATGAV